MIYNLENLHFLRKKQPDSSSQSLDHDCPVFLFSSVIPAAFSLSSPTVWERIKLRFKRTTPFLMRLNRIQNSLDDYRASQLERSSGQNKRSFPRYLAQQVTSCLLTLEQMKQGSVREQNRKSLSEFFDHLSTIELDILLRFISETQIEQEIRGVESHLISTCTALLSMESIQALLADKKQNFDYLEKMAEDIAQFFPDLKEIPNISSSERSLFHSFVGFMRTVVESFSLGLEDVFRPNPSENRTEAAERLNQVYSLIATIGSCCGMLFVLAGNVFSGALLPWVRGGVIAITLFFLFLGNKVRKKRPPLLSHGFINLTQELHKQPNSPIVGRHAEIQTVIDCLGNLEHDSRCPLLCGKSGVGKSEIVRALAQKIASGKHPELSQKQIFYINSSALLESGDRYGGLYQSRLQTLLREIRGKEDQVVLFFDEIDTLYNSKDNKLPRQFQELLDNKKIHCIAATTNRAYEATIAKDESLNRRFRIVPVQEMDEEDMLTALSNFMTHQHPDIEFRKEAIEEALALSQEEEYTSRLSRAKNLLIEAANAFRVFRGKECQELTSVQEQYARAQRELKDTHRILSFDSNSFSTLKNYRGQIEELEKIIAINERLIKERGILIKAKNRWHQELYNNAHQVVELKDEDSKKRFFFLLKYMQHAALKRLDKQRQRMTERNLPIKIEPDHLRKMVEQNLD